MSEAEAQSDHPNLTAETLCRGRMVCVLPEGHVLGDKASVTPLDIDDYPLVSYDRDTPQGKVIEEAFNEAGVTRDIAIEVRFGHAACALVQAGAGVALVDEFSVLGRTFAGVASCPFKPEKSFTMSILRNNLRPLSHAGEGLSQHLRAVAEGYAALR